MDSATSVLLAVSHGNDQPRTVTSSTRHVAVQYLVVTSASDVSAPGGLMASYVTLGTVRSTSLSLSEALCFRVVRPCVTACVLYSCFSIRNRKWSFLPARRYVSAGTSYDPVSVSVCLSVCVLSKWLGGSSWVLACRLLLIYPALCFKEIRVSPK